LVIEVSIMRQHLAGQQQNSPRDRVKQQTYSW
jgi:hypothetical protein